MVVALSVLSGIFSGPLSAKSQGQAANGYYHLTPATISPAMHVIAFALIAYFIMLGSANAEIRLLPQQAEAASSFVFDRPNQNDLPLALKLSPFTPAPNEYKRFEEMSKDDRRLALGQVAVGLLAQSLDNSFGRAVLAVTEPLKGAGSGISCKQRFSTQSYLLRCRLKF